MRRKDERKHNRSNLWRVFEHGSENCLGVLANPLRRTRVNMVKGHCEKIDIGVPRIHLTENENKTNFYFCFAFVLLNFDGCHLGLNFRCVCMLGSGVRGVCRSL